MSLNMLGAFHVGVTMVGADIDNNTVVDAGGGTAHGETRVAGSLSLANSPSAVVNTRTSVSAATSVRYRLPSANVVAGSTAVTGALTRTTLRGGSIQGATAVTAPTLNLAIRILSSQRSPIAGKTAVTGKVSYTLAQMLATVSTRSNIFANLIKPRFLNGSNIAAGTSVTGAETTHLLRGVIPTRTTAAGQVVVKGRFTGAIADRTTVSVVSGKFQLAHPLSGLVTGISALKSRLHVYPIDFTDVVIRMRTAATGRVNVNTSIKVTSPIQAKTAVVAMLSNRILLRTNGMALRTVVTGKARYGFGADLSLRSVIHGRLGIQTGINSWKGRTITGRTVVTGSAPNTGFTGKSVCKTAVVALLIRATVVRAAVVSMTQLHSHFSGRFAHDGPVGSVALTVVPHGDLGTPNEINCSTVPTADITVERQRMLVIFGNAGVSVDRTLVAHGMATAGTGIRQVGHPVNLPEKVSRQVTYYV